MAGAGWGEVLELSAGAPPHCGQWGWGHCKGVPGSGCLWAQPLQPLQDPLSFWVLLTADRARQIWNPLLRQPQARPAPFWHPSALLPFTLVFIYYFSGLLTPPTGNRPPRVHSFLKCEMLLSSFPASRKPDNSRRWYWGRVWSGRWPQKTKVFPVDCGRTGT